jgi:hypothetical protein
MILSFDISLSASSAFGLSSKTFHILPMQPWPIMERKEKQCGEGEEYFLREGFISVWPI